MDQRLDEAVPLPLQLVPEFGEGALEGGELKETLEGGNALLVLFLHEEEASLQEQPPLVEGLGIDLNVVGPGQYVVGLVEVLLLDLDPHHHLYRCRHVLSVVVDLQGLLKAQ